MSEDVFTLHFFSFIYIAKIMIFCSASTFNNLLYFELVKLDLKGVTLFVRFDYISHLCYYV